MEKMDKLIEKRESDAGSGALRRYQNVLRYMSYTIHQHANKSENANFFDKRN